MNFSRIAREVSEEISINLPLERFQPLTIYEGIDIDRPHPGRVLCRPEYVSTQINVTPGCLVVATAQRIPLLGWRLTAYAQLALKAFGID